MILCTLKEKPRNSEPPSFGTLPTFRCMDAPILSCNLSRNEIASRSR